MPQRRSDGSHSLSNRSLSVFNESAGGERARVFLTFIMKQKQFYMTSFEMMQVVSTILQPGKVYMACIV